jgi:hypothetical protein
MKVAYPSYAASPWEGIFMKTTRKLSRRSFLTRVAGGAVAGGGALMLLSGSAEALQVNDADSGPNADPANRGRGSNRIRGCSDNDSGSNADPAGNGRGNGHSDADSGPNSDPANCGRGARR